jgi:hypothetical protein
VETYGRAEAVEMIKRSQDDYREQFGGLHDLVAATMEGFTP